MDQGCSGTYLGWVEVLYPPSLKEPVGFRDRKYPTDSNVMACTLHAPDKRQQPVNINFRCAKSGLSSVCGKK
jgi:hypothetical protein